MTIRALAACGLAGGMVAQTTSTIDPSGGAVHLGNAYYSSSGGGASASVGGLSLPGLGEGIGDNPVPNAAGFSTWDGGGADDFWTTKLNWLDDKVPKNSNTSKIAFDGSTRTSPDMDANWTVNSLQFDATASSFTLGSTAGKSLTFAGVTPSLLQMSPNGQTINNAVRLNATTTVDTSGAGALTLDGAVSGTGGIDKLSAGTLILAGNNNYTGPVTINQGVVRAQHANALGSTAGGVTVAAGAALEVQGGIAVGNEALGLQGTGVAGGGALRNTSGNNSLAGAITLGSATRINSDGGTLTLSGNVSGAGQNLTVGGAGNVTLSGVIGTGAGTLTKDGAGTLTLSGAGANTYTGNTTIEGGTLKLQKTAGVNAIAGSGATTITINTSGTLLFAANNQVADTVKITHAGGILDINSRTETLGSLTLTENSYLDYSTALGGYGTLNFAASDAATWTPGKTLYVRNYTDDGGFTSDFLHFGNTAAGLGAGGPYYSQIVFIDPSGTPGNYPGLILADGRVIPIPEPGGLLAVSLLAVGLGWRERRCWQRLCAQWLASSGCQ